MNFFTQLLLDQLAWLLLAVPTLAVCAVLWFSLMPPRALLPPQRHRFTAITAPEVFFIFVGSALFISIVYDAMRSAYGEPPEERKFLWQYTAVILAFPLFMAFSWAALRLASGTTMYQIGLQAHRWRQFTVLGGLVWLVSTPVILLINLVVNWVAIQLDQRPTPHTLTQIMRGENPLLEWSILLASALIVAPLLEEFLFRGVIQKWTMQRFYHAHVILVAACIVTILNNRPFAVAATAFVLLLIPGYLLCPLLFHKRTETARLLDLAGESISANRCRAVYATALIFAGSHPWPTPIPLFFLGLLLGWLAYRTQSLVGPIVLHLLFNAVACIQVAIELQRTAAGQ